jgi:hypothetical protein
MDRWDWRHEGSMMGSIKLISFISWFPQHQYDGRIYLMLVSYLKAMSASRQLLVGDGSVLLNY